MPTARAILRRTGANLSRAARRALAQATLPRGPGAWLVVRLDGFLDDVVAPALPFAREHRATLLEVLETLDAASRDSRIDGVLLRFSSSPVGWSKLLSLRRAVERVRERGTRVAAYAESLDMESFLVASAADRVWLPPTGQLLLLGLRAEPIFLGRLLERLHVRPEVVRVGSHKTAGERFTRDSMSPEEREQVEAYLDDLYEQLVGGIARGRGLEPAAVRDWIDRGPLLARAAVEAGLVDACLYPDEIEGELAALGRGGAGSPDSPKVQLVEGATYHALRARDPGWRPLWRGLPRLAYVVARGAIHRGSSPRGIAYERLRELLERLRRDEEVRAIVLRINSPGGDATASDLLWRCVSLAKRDKPVVVSMGDVVASGGYYAAAGADAVYAEAGTLTGSIGVVGGKLDLSALYDRIGVGRDAVERGARAGLLSETRGFTSDERAALRDQMSAFYDTFLERVAEGRRLPLPEVGRLAQGRLWSGARARQVGLVDEIGGPLEALSGARRRAGLSEDERVLVDVMPRLPHLPGLGSLLRMLPGRAILP